MSDAAVFIPAALLATIVTLTLVWPESGETRATRWGRYQLTRHPAHLDFLAGGAGCAWIGARWRWIVWTGNSVADAGHTRTALGARHAARHSLRELTRAL